MDHMYQLGCFRVGNDAVVGWAVAVNEERMRSIKNADYELLHSLMLFGIPDELKELRSALARELDHREKLSKRLKLNHLASYLDDVGYGKVSDKYQLLTDILTNLKPVDVTVNTRLEADLGFCKVIKRFIGANGGEPTIAWSVVTTDDRSINGNRQFDDFDQLLDYLTVLTA